MFEDVVRGFVTPALIVFSIMNYVDIDSEEELIFYIASTISINNGMYLVAPTVMAFKVKKYLKSQKS